MRGLLFVMTSVYTALLITRPHEFVPALAESSLLQIVLLSAMAVWLLTTDKGLEIAQFRVIPWFLLGVWLSLGFAGWWGGIVPALERLVPPIFLFVIISGCVRSVQSLKTYSSIIIICACILVLHGHIQSTTGLGWTGQPMIQGRITYSGIFNDPNDLGLLIVLSITLSIFQLRVRTSRLARIALWAGIAWLLYGVYLTDSRGTMLAVITVLGLEAWRAYGKAVVIAAGLVAVPLLFAYTRLAQLDPEEASAGNRVDAWYEGIQMLLGNPVFGVGWGMFSDFHSMTAHNSLVLAMAELGLFGYSFWMALVLVSGVMIFRISLPNQISDPGSADLKPAGRGWARTSNPAARPFETGPAFGDGAGWGSGAPASVENRNTAVVSTTEIQGEELKSAEIEVERLAARSLLFAAIGFMVGAFFLSQSYKAMLFINCGLVVGRYFGMREAGIPVPEFRLGIWMPVAASAALASVIGIWILVKILL